LNESSDGIRLLAYKKGKQVELVFAQSLAAKTFPRWQKADRQTSASRIDS
jgi:hypothetical protein